MSETNKTAREWFKQSDYDFGTAEAMFKSRRYIYAVFMCHLCIEKALKGIIANRDVFRPKTMILCFCLKWLPLITMRRMLILSRP